MLKVLTPAQSTKRVEWLRAHGFKVSRVRLRDGTTVVLKTKARQTRACHHVRKPKRKRKRAVKRLHYW